MVEQHFSLTEQRLKVLAKTLTSLSSLNAIYFAQRWL
jgi:hypothetical protein